MSQHSIIEHRANYHFLKIEEDYLSICEGKHQHCKAAILSLLERWMNNKRTEGCSDDDLYVYLSYPQFSKNMFELFGRSTIIKSLEDLISDGLVKSRPYIDIFNQRTFEYRLDIKSVNDKLRNLPERKTGSSKINYPSSKVNEGSFKSKLGGSSKVNEGSFKSKRNIDTTQIHDIDTTQIDKEESVPPTSTQPSLEEVSSSETHSLFDSHENATPHETVTPPKKKPTRKKTPPTENTLESLLTSASSEVQAIVNEWRSIFKDPIAITEILIKHATTLSDFKPQPGEIAACRLWMYASDQKGWYRMRGMHLGDVAREFEKFRSLASIPEQKPVLQLVPTSQNGTPTSKKVLSPEELKSMPMAGW